MLESQPPRVREMRVEMLNGQVQASPLTVSEQVEACCTIAREQLERGNYDAGCAALRPWWTLAEWPRHHNLSHEAAAELLLTAGTLSGWIAGTRQVHDGHPNQARL